jgi:hypothetical protein
MTVATLKPNAVTPNHPLQRHAVRAMTSNESTLLKTSTHTEYYRG